VYDLMEGGGGLIISLLKIATLLKTQVLIVILLSAGFHPHCCLSSFAVLFDL